MATMGEVMRDIMQKTLSLSDDKYKELLQDKYTDITAADAHRAREGLRAVMQTTDQAARDKALKDYAAIHRELERKYKRKREV